MPLTRGRCVFIDELIENVEYIANFELVKIFRSKTFRKNEEGVDLLDDIDFPAFQLGDIVLYKRRFNALKTIRQMVVHFAEHSIRRIYESMFALGGEDASLEVDECLSRRCSPLHRIDRFPGLCSHIKDTLNAQIIKCIQRGIVSLENDLAKDMSTIAMDSDGQNAPFLSTLLDKWVFKVAVAVHFEVENVLKTLYSTVIPPSQALLVNPSLQPQPDPNLPHLWVENVNFVLERSKLEGKLHRLHVQLARLEKCVATADRSNHNTELRLAVDQAAAESVGSSNAVDNAAMLNTAVDNAMHTCRPPAKCFCPH